MTEEQKNELYNAIEFDEDKMNIASSIDIPKDVSSKNRVTSFVYILN